MRCAKCRKKVGLLVIECKHCTKSFCSACITLENHACEAIEDSIQKSKDLLDKRLSDAVYEKKGKFNLE